MTPTTVDCDNNVTVTAEGALYHRCPFVDERDFGAVTITWRPDGQTLELHTLRAYLDTFTNTRMSHESITDRITHDLAVIPGITAVQVNTTWHTAGFTVTVRGGETDPLLRQSVDTTGA